MLKGDLTSTPLASLLLELADDSATGCLVITDTTEDEALVYVKNGLIYSVSVPGNRPQLGAKLVSSGALAPEALSEALEAQRTELQGWRLGELLVHLGYVEQPVVEAFVAEQVSEALWDLLRWSNGRWKFRKNVKAREDVGPPMAIVDLLETLRERGYVWEGISAVVHGPSAVPRLSTRGDTSSETTLDNDAWSMLCKIDGERSVAELAADCGYTLFEAGHVIVSLVQAGLVDIDEDIDLEGSALYGATTLSSALAGDLDDAAPAPAQPEDEDALARLARLVTEVAGTGEPSDEASAATPVAARVPVAPAQRRDRELDNTMTVAVNRHTGESFAASIARVSGALSEVLGEMPPPDIDTEELAARRRAAPSTDDPEWQRRKRLRTAAAAELASAQALIETLRPDRDTAVDVTATPEFTGDVPKLESPTAERERIAARDAEAAARHAADEAAREAAEQFARAAAGEAERVAAEQEAARIAAEAAAAADAARLEAEAAAAQAAEDARLATEHAAAEEAARLAAEAEAAAAEAERVQAERQAAEEVAWAEYWQREEAERAAAEQAVRAAAEEAERQAAAQAEADRIAAEAEAERLAAEEAERQAAAQAEADRIAVEAEAERLAAEEAERQAAAQAEADRIAAEAEAERQAVAQVEADRIAAEAEAERLAAEAEAEAERLAAEEAERQAKADAEAAVAEAKAEAAARRKAENAAAAEAAKRQDEAAAAAALLAEFAASSADEEPEAATAEAPEPEPAPEVRAPAEVREPVAAGRGWSEADTTDTAALLRELSSLGNDDDRDAPSGPAVPSRPRPHAPEKKVKKKIGLFGL